jgi:hypothetical protein
MQLFLEKQEILPTEASLQLFGCHQGVVGYRGCQASPCHYQAQK